MTTQKATRCRIPDVNIAKAIKAYYAIRELSNKNIREIFNNQIGSTVFYKIKAMALDRMTEKGVQALNFERVTTEEAFEAWGLDIADLERRYSKLKKLGLLDEGE